MQGRYHLLESFLPIGLLARIYGAARVRPSAVQFPAAVIFVDVSRYTALVEQLARRGQEGLEQIPRLLSLSYTRCADCVSNHRGEVLCFAGDSLLAYWPADHEKLGVRRTIGYQLRRDDLPYKRSWRSRHPQRNPSSSPRRHRCRASLGGRFGRSASLESPCGWRSHYGGCSSAGHCAQLELRGLSCGRSSAGWRECHREFQLLARSRRLSRSSAVRLASRISANAGKRVPTRA